jgi:hypothetical protein
MLTFHMCVGFPLRYPVIQLSFYPDAWSEVATMVALSGYGDSSRCIGTGG